MSDRFRLAGLPYRKAGVPLGILMVAASGVVMVQWHQHHLVALGVQSDSMKPTFSRGDALLVTKSTPGLIRTGDVVSYPDTQHPSLMITHRVVEVNNYTGRLVTRGDANVTSDPPVTTLAVTGVVRYTLPKVGYAIDALRSWPGIVLFVYLPALLIVLQELRYLVRMYAVPTYVLRR